MDYRAMEIEGAWEITPRQFGDPRGVFLEWFKEGPFAKNVGHALHLAQANLSVSAAGVVRGIHFADVPPSQAKYVTCAKGTVMDVVIDIRVGSPTFGRWDSVILDDVTRRAVYVSEGLGHAFMSLEDDSTVIYLCSEIYAPEREHGIHAFDPDIAIAWPTTARDGTVIDPSLSERDEVAPTLMEMIQAGALPTFVATRDFRRSL